ncbi:C-type lectin domain family 2 member D-like isoform X2 [Rissa tridactyla]|uniref:C-type lectin domain family 2 member D-like isoform X2 n=1 Tax=Rissa tridactyla TaxID=75485 RepID=UPI0023BA9D4D|nr:C-type lectin domain family 2 member D-like isoform X2 [Rissa tridactyla]
MFSGISQYDDNSCGGRTESRPGLKQVLPAVVMPWVQDTACSKQGAFTSQFPWGPGEKNGCSCKDGNKEKPLSPQDAGVSPHPEVPGDTHKMTYGGVLGELYMLHPVWVVVLAVLVALVLAQAVAVAALSGRHGGDPAVPVALVLGCPDDWVGYRNVCYSFSRAEGSWNWSQEQCSSHGASLAMPRTEGEMEFLWRLKGNMDYWLGLRRQGERLQWVDGGSFNQRFVVHGQGECAYLYDGVVASAGCSQSRPYICSKPQALM